MRKLRTVVKVFMFPAALFASIGWIAIFVVIGIKMPHENIGLITLLVFAGLILFLPWLAMAMAISRRMGWSDDLTSSGKVSKP